MSIHSTGLGDEPHVSPRRARLDSAIEPLVLRPREAWRLLGIGNTRGYELLSAGELESFKDGKSRKVTMASIKRYIERRLAESRAAAE